MASSANDDQTEMPSLASDHGDDDLDDMENRPVDDYSDHHHHHDCEARMQIDLIRTVDNHPANATQFLEGRFVKLKLYDVVWEFRREPSCGFPDPASRSDILCRCFRLVLHDAHDVNDDPSSAITRTPCPPCLNPLYTKLLAPFASSPELLWKVGARLNECCARIDSAKTFREVFDASLRFSEGYAEAKRELEERMEGKEEFEGEVEVMLGEGSPDLSWCVFLEAMEAAWMCKSAKVAVGEAAIAAAHLLSTMILPGETPSESPQIDMDDVCERAKRWLQKEAAIDSGFLLQWWTVEINEHFVYCTIKDLRQLLLNDVMVAAARQVGIFVDKPLIVKLDKELRVVAVDQLQQQQQGHGGTVSAAATNEVELEGSGERETSNSMASSSSSNSSDQLIMSRFEEEYWNSSCEKRLKNKPVTKLGTQILVKRTVEEVMSTRKRTSTTKSDGGNNKNRNVLIEMMEAAGRLIGGIHKLCIVCSCQKGLGDSGMSSLICGEEACRITWSAWHTAAPPDITQPLLLPPHHHFFLYHMYVPRP